MARSASGHARRRRERLPFDLAYGLCRLVIEWGGGPFTSARDGVMTLKVFKRLANENLVLITNEHSERLTPTGIRTTITAMLTEHLGLTPPPSGIRIEGYVQSRRPTSRYVEVTEAGLAMVVGAVQRHRERTRG
jgi:hypothetical protein